MDDLTREFLIESQEGLDRMERCMTELETRPQDTALLAEIFRSVHTIKGTTGFLGFARLEKLAHAGENLLGMLREGKLAADEAIISGLLELLDGLRSILKSIEAEGSEGEGDDGALIRRLEGLQKPAQAAAQEKKPARARTVRRAPAQRAAAAGVVQVGLKTQAAAAAACSEAETAREAIAGAAAQAAPGGAAASAAESTLRVDVTLLNQMMNLVGELVLTRNQVLQATAADAKMTPLSRRLDMVTADLREAVMKARMQPVSNLFSKMPRMVRDLSHTLGRRVRLEVEGQETELDKSLLEAIKDPLTHAVRNAMDHGIEPPELREAAGKEPEGMLKLRASHEGSHVVIEVSDDGAGIAVDKIRQKALERGLLTAERAEPMSERELLQMIFVPGFSTAAAVTNVSGRGVGMDVVRTNVERIGGKVEIESRVGRGTTLRLRIPLTLAIIPALIVRSLNQSFALPQGALLELVHVPPAQAATALEWMEDAPLYRLRGKLLPLVFLDRMLAPAREAGKLEGKDSFIAVLDADGRRFGLVVDGLADPEEIVVKPLSAALKEIGLYTGATVLGNAELALILDPAGIAMRAGVAINSEETSASEPAQDAKAARSEEYLLVEAGGQRAAVRLSDVLRIERIPMARIEHLGNRPVLSFGGELLPLEDPGGVLRSAEQTPQAQMVVVVCRTGCRQVGIAVTQVLDVAAGNALREAGSGAPARGVTRLKEQVTGIVNLESVAPLPREEPAEWEPAEAVR